MQKARFFGQNKYKKQYPPKHKIDILCMFDKMAERAIISK